MFTVGDEIVAVKVTACGLCVDGFGDEVSVAVLVVCRTSWFNTADVLPEIARIAHVHSLQQDTDPR